MQNLECVAQKMAELFLDAPEPPSSDTPEYFFLIICWDSSYELCFLHFLSHFLANLHFVQNLFETIHTNFHSKSGLCSSKKWLSYPLTPLRPPLLTPLTKNILGSP